MFFPDLQQFNGIKRFDLERSCCFGALLLDEERGRLFVGARNFLLSLSLDNISKQEQKVQHTSYFIHNGSVKGNNFPTVLYVSHQLIKF